MESFYKYPNIAQSIKITYTNVEHLNAQKGFFYIKSLTKDFQFLQGTME